MPNQEIKLFLYLSCWMRCKMQQFSSVTLSLNRCQQLFFFSLLNAVIQIDTQIFLIRDKDIKNWRFAATVCVSERVGRCESPPMYRSEIFYRSAMHIWTYCGRTKRKHLKTAKRQPKAASLLRNTCVGSDRRVGCVTICWFAVLSSK